MTSSKTAVSTLHLWSPPETAINHIAEQTLPDGTPLYAPEELSHLVDVKHLTDTIRIIGLSALALLFVCIISLYPPHPRRFALQRTAVGGLILVPTAFILLIGVTLLWPLFFVKFHELLFADGTWTFNETSGLIRLFPELFWFRVGQTILMRLFIVGVFTFLFSAALFVRFDRHQTKEKNRQPLPPHPSWRTNYQHELRWLKLGLFTVIPNALIWYLLGYAILSFRSAPFTSLIAAAVTLLVGWLTSTAFDKTHHKPISAYDLVEINEYMVSLFGLGAVLMGIGLVSLGSFPLLAFLAPGIILSGLFILILGGGQLCSEHFMRRRILE